MVPLFGRTIVRQLYCSCESRDYSYPCTEDKAKKHIVCPFSYTEIYCFIDKCLEIRTGTKVRQVSHVRCKIFQLNNLGQKLLNMTHYIGTTDITNHFTRCCPDFPSNSTQV